MKVLDLQCAHGHAFEGWFASEDDFQGQLGRGLVTCPVCGDSAVVKQLSAPRLNLGASAPPAPNTGPGVPAERSAQAAVLQRIRQLLAQSEDVGARFAAEARRIHAGEAPERSIRGQATVDEAAELLEEGIPVLPLPAALKETLQ